MGIASWPRWAGRLGLRRTVLWLPGAALAALLATGAPANPEPGGPPAGLHELEPLDLALLERAGASLRTAIEAIHAGETERAERLLRAIADRHPVVADHADLVRLRLYVLTGRQDEVIALAVGWPHADSPLRPVVQEVLGQALADAGDEEGARIAWELALSGTQDDDRRAALRFELARSHLRSGQPELAGSQLLRIWSRHPRAPVAEEAERELVVLEQQLGQILRTADRYRRRGDAFYRARRNEQALEAYELALEIGELEGAALARAQRNRADTLFRLRRYTQAAQAYAALEPDAESRIAHARSVARTGDVPAAAEELERIAQEVRGVQSSRATLLAALLWEGEGKEERSRRLFASLANSPTQTSYSGVAQWRLGWEAYRNGRYEEALELFEKLEQAGGDPLGSLRARYWGARAAERAGREGAADAFGAIAREFPLSYYGWRSAPRAAQGPSVAPRLELARGTAALSPRELARPRILLEAGLQDEAREELQGLMARARGLDDRLALAQLYSDTGDFHRPQRLVVDAYQETLARGPGPGPVEMWWHAWPLPYRDAVRGAITGRNDLEPALVYAVMREESGYRPEVISVSGARGLLQLMPETAQRVALREALRGFDAEVLFLPALNIRLGAAYLDELLRRFSGHASAAIGSYNAGPHRVVNWLDGPALEDDEWVEAIPYDQTRAYVKRVLRSVHAYRVLY
jgi:soluble lytic murein transglycosylase